MSNTQANHKATFRYDINALRAFAVFGVILFHYKVGIFKGGFTGVDVFFVISGYLMSKIIINGISKQKFSYIDYLRKRIQRIVPALLFLITVLTIAGFFLYFPEDYKLNEKNAAASIAFFSNILYWRSSSYFAPASDTNLFLHTWSLSVEWQFYLIFPLILIILRRYLKTNRNYLQLFIPATIFLIIFSVYFTKHSPTTSFYLLPTRAWEMLLGGVAFLLEPFLRGDKWRKPIAVLGYLMILGSFLLLNNSLPWPGIFTLLPTSATFLIIISSCNDFFVIKNSATQFIGKISYSLYLWHWPVYVITQYYGIGTETINVLLFIIVSVTLGYISFNYIESIKFKRSRQIIVLMVVCFAVTAGISRYNTNTILFQKKTIEITSYPKRDKKDKQYGIGICHVDNFQEYNKDSCLCIDKGKKNILLIGDSHMGELAQSFREKTAGMNVHILQATASGTSPTLKDFQHNYPKRRKLMDYIYKDFIPHNADDIDGIILAGSWSGEKKEKDGNLLIALEETVNYLKKYHIKLIVIGQTERYTIPYVTVAARNYEKHRFTNNEYLDTRANVVDKELQKKLGYLYIKVINTNTFPAVSKDGTPYMWDEHHLTKYGADLLVDKFLAKPLIKELISNKPY
jgi:peptidoglycan/LPS O-acetylase OafA/YrhL